MRASDNDAARPGLVVAAHGRHCVVESPDGSRCLCHAKGKKNETVVGDRVQWRPTGDEGVIARVEERRSLFYRQDEVRTKSFAANLDQVLVLIAAEAQHIAPLIALNKSDLVEPFERAWRRLVPYHHMGYGVLPLSLRLSQDTDREHLLRHMQDKTTLVLGPSGAGKSTLINLLVPQAQAQTGEISSIRPASRNSGCTTSRRCSWPR